jgi:membrane-bound metal-dependent hydrolase YbcI (DUF457 family)
MSPVTHLLLSWSFSSIFPFDRKDRVLVTLAGVVPDLDGAGMLLDLFSYRAGQPLELWIRFHHVLCHNIAFGLFIALFTYCLATRRLLAGITAFLVFHLHLVCDILGSRGPDEAWSVPYLLPFSRAGEIVWAHQWALNSWQNFAITFLALVFFFYQGWRKGISPLEIVSRRANDAFVTALRLRFGLPTKCERGF